jgi:DNA-binding transcriptional MerR regulator
MAELVERTGVPKSTILYYIKEGLLPQPERIKQNVCLYDVEYVERIKFIKFLQNNYGKSISELKAAICSHGYDFSQGSDILIEFLEKLSGTSADSAKMGIKELSKKIGIKESLITELVDKKIVIPIIDGVFDDKDAEMILLYDRLIKAGWSIEFFEKYAQIAAELAHYSTQKVMEMKKRLKEDGDVNNEMHHLMFEVPLSVQPYIINRLGMKEHKRMTQEQESKICNKKSK